MKKVLIITYYWPPSGGAGVYRWLKFSKHMQAFGWIPVIYTPSNPAIPIKDDSLLKDVPENIEVLKHPIFEPLEFYHKIISGKNDNNVGIGLLSSKKKPPWKMKLLFWIRGNLFVPDPRKYWVRPSVKFLLKHLKNNSIDAIITSGPPHSMHLIGLKVAKNTGIKWLADFRDPWTNIDFYHQLGLTKFADKANRRLEKKVLASADLVTTVSSNWAKDLESLGAKKIVTITNGFDHEEFERVSPAQNTKFSILHVGSMNNDRNPILLWKTLSSLLAHHADLKTLLEIILIGTVDYRVFEELNKYQLSEYVKHIAYMEHKKVVQFLCSSSILLLPLNNTPNVMGIIPGKLFEYLASGRPIISIGPENGDTATILKETRGGEIIAYNDATKMTSVLNHYFELFKSKKLKLAASEIDKYSRKNLAKKVCNYLDQLTK